MIRRRILLNYRVDAEVARGVMPSCFRPKLVDGFAVAGICLIRLEEVRPKGFPAMMGMASENSAHRIAVHWDDADGVEKEGVFVPRRDTDSWVIAMVGGRLFPGVHHHSKFTVEDQEGKISLKIDAVNDTVPLIDLEVNESESFPGDSVFGSLEEASQFFEAGCVGYFSRPDSCKLDGLLLKVDDWKVTPLKIERVSSSYYDNRSIFSEGSIELDHALLMRDIPHEWHSEPEMVGD